MEISGWKEQLEEERNKKDESFIADPSSPVPLENRFKFEGLNYYPLEQNWRFELELREHSEKKTLSTEDSLGGLRNFIRWGEFQFRFNDKEYVVQAYKVKPEDQHLFIPFRDGTSGNQTYGAGRYLDLLAERDFDPGNGKWILDFNRAYNPFCAYNKSYACPLVPAENWLEVPIEAGEKNPS
jgi:uncharacterized protein (DUF1684 family)